MKRILLASILILASVSGYAETTICDGRFENDQPVHVKIDWDKLSVNINKAPLIIRGNNVTGNGIVTNECFNTFGHKFYFVILHSDGHDYIWQTSAHEEDDGSHTIMHRSKLSCSKSFKKPFMDRMLSINKNNTNTPAVFFYVNMWIELLRIITTSYL